MRIHVYMCVCPSCMNVYMDMYMYICYVGYAHTYVQIWYPCSLRRSVAAQVQRIPTGCGCVCVCLIVCDLETSTMRCPRPLGCSDTEKMYVFTCVCMFVRRLFGK